jgi:hypothetical protein
MSELRGMAEPGPTHRGARRNLVSYGIGHQLVRDAERSTIIPAL